MDDWKWKIVLGFAAAGLLVLSAYAYLSGMEIMHDALVLCAGIAMGMAFERGRSSQGE